MNFGDLQKDKPY